MGLGRMDFPLAHMKGGKHDQITIPQIESPQIESRGVERFA
jgi:hypothetical protein